MDNLQLENRLIRMEQLLIANKEVLTLDETCQYNGISRSDIYKLTFTEKIPHFNPRGKLIYFEREKLNPWY